MVKISKIQLKLYENSDPLVNVRSAIISGISKSLTASMFKHKRSITFLFLS